MIHVIMAAVEGTLHPIQFPYALVTDTHLFRVSAFFSYTIPTPSFFFVYTQSCTIAFPSFLCCVSSFVSATLL